LPTAAAWVRQEDKTWGRRPDWPSYKSAVFFPALLFFPRHFLGATKKFTTRGGISF
jgi:hypothetical protein